MATHFMFHNKPFCTQSMLQRSTLHMLDRIAPLYCGKTDFRKPPLSNALDLCPAFCVSTPTARITKAKSVPLPTVANLLNLKRGTEQQQA